MTTTHDNLSIVDRFGDRVHGEAHAMSIDNIPDQPTPPNRHDRPRWTEDRIRELGAVTDLRTAASIFGLSRSVAYDLARRDQFPVPLIRAGARYRVPVAAILAVLHLADQPRSTPTT